MGHGSVAWVMNSEYGTHDLMIIGLDQYREDLSLIKTQPDMLFYTNVFLAAVPVSGITVTYTRCFRNLKTVIWIGVIMIMTDLLT